MKHFNISIKTNKRNRQLNKTVLILTIAALSLYLLLCLAACDTTTQNDNTPTGNVVIVTPATTGDANHSESTDAAGATATPAKTVKIKYSAEAGGSISGVAEWDQEEGTKAGPVAAIADEDHYFTGWSDGVDTAERSDTITSEFVEITAKFAEKLTVRCNSEPSDAAIFDSGAVAKAIPGETLTVKVSAGEGFVFKGWSDGVSEQERSITVNEPVVLTALFDEIPSIPDIYMTTEGGASITSKTEYLTASLSITELASVRNAEGLGCRIRGHGNSTWDHYKETKPSFRLKLDEKTELAGVGHGPGKDYVLLSNHSDATMLRNYIVLTLASQFSGYKFVSDFRFVNLYLNGKPMGLYMLCEKIKTGSGRIEIEVDKTGEEADTGFLIEIDNRVADNPGDDVFFTVPGTECMFVIKSDGNSDKQLAFISEYMKSFYKACKSGDRSEVEALADLSSIIDSFILEEFTRERDSGFASFYMVKEKGGLLRFDCPWDFDLALGNDNMYRATKGLLLDSGSGQNAPNPFYKALYEHDWFRRAVASRFSELEPVIRSMISSFTDEAEFLRQANAADDRLWSLYSHQLLWAPERLYTLPDYDSHLEYLRNWMTERLDWLAGKIG